MLVKRFEDDESLFQYCGMTGLNSIQLKSISQFFDLIESLKKNIIVQCFNCAHIASWEHVFFAAYNAMWSYINGKRFSEDLGIQFLLFASGQRQIKIAIERLGLTSDLTEMGVVIFGNDPEQFSRVIKEIKAQVGGNEEFSTLNLNEHKFKQVMNDFNISEKELQAIMEKNNIKYDSNSLIKIIMSRMALLSLEK